MKNIMNLFCLLLFFLFSTTVLGQGFLDRVAKKASEKIEQKAEERAEKKMDEKIDESLDKMEESMEGEEVDTASGNNEARDQKRMNALMKKMGVSSEPVPVADKYHFSSKMRMHFKIL
jgi:ABC-type nitrate/sulfonate/bicarbonate transport system substrate-binding protein